MSASAGPSTSAGGAGREGPGGRDDKSTNRARKVTSTPRQSAATQLQLKVMRKTLERLSEERVDLTDIQDGLKGALLQIEEEIAQVQKMWSIADAASDFQHGLPYEDSIHPVWATQEGSSSASGSGSAPPPTTGADRVSAALSATSWEVVKQILNQDQSDNDLSEDDMPTDDSETSRNVYEDESSDVHDTKVSIEGTKEEPAPPRYFSDSDFE